MASSTGNIKQAYDVNGGEIYPKVILDSLEGEGGTTGIEVIREAIGGMGMENLKGVSVEYDDGGNHYLVFKSHYEESAGGYLRETVVNEGPLIIGKYSETNPYAEDHVYVSKNLSILEDINALEFAANADAVNRRDISGKIAHTNNSIQIINYDTAGKLELFGGGETVNDCVSISASSMNIPKDASITKNLTVSGSTTVATTSGATLSVGGDATFSKKITVDGKSRFNDDVSLHGRTASNRGRSPMLSFTSYQEGTSTTNKTNGYIVENYDASGKSSLNIYDVSTANALASLSGTNKRFNVQLNGYGMLYLDGVAKTASIYADSDDNAYLSIDGSDNNVYLKASEDTYINLDDENGEHDIAINADDNTFLHLWGGYNEGVVHLNATSGTKLDMYGDVGNVHLNADSKNYLLLNGEEDYVRLQSDSSYYLNINGSDGVIDLWAGDTTRLILNNEGDEHDVNLYADNSTYLKLWGGANEHKVKLYADNSTYLTIYGGDTESVVLKAKDGMHLGMNDSSGYLTLQAKSGTYLGFDVSGNNKSVGLYADGSTKLLLDGLKGVSELYADDETYLEVHTYEDTDDDDNPYKVNEIRLTCRSNSNSYLHIKDDTTFAENAYIELKSGNAKLYLDGHQSYARLSATSSTYIKVEDDIQLHKSNSAILTVDSNVVKSTIPMTAKVNGVSDVYLGCPIGTIVMWPTATAPTNWMNCDGGTITLTTGTASNYDYHPTGDYYYKASDSKYSKIVSVIGSTYGYTGNYPYNITGLKVPNLSGRFPLGYGKASSGTYVTNHNMGETGGDEKILLSSDESGLRSHRHQLLYRYPESEGGGQNSDYYIGVGDSGARNKFAYYPSSSYGGAGQNGMNTNTALDAASAHNNMPPFLTVNFIIKYQ